MTTIAPEHHVETRSGSKQGVQVADVNHPKRLVTVVAMPYETPTRIVERGREFVEVVTRGAFDGSERRASRVKANREHSVDRPVGRCLALHPSRTEGLVAEVKIAKTGLGDETLELCADGILDASAGFQLLCGDDGYVRADAETWEQQGTVRRLNRLWLDHLAFVFDPAYPDAVVTDVRSAPPAGEPVVVATPNLDMLHSQALQKLWDDMERRYTRS